MKKKLVIKTALYINGSSKRAPIYTIEGKGRKVLETLLKEKLMLPVVDFEGTKVVDFSKLSTGGEIVVKTVKKPDTTAKATSLALPVKITIEY